MEELLEHLSKSKLRVFEASELNEVILMVYGIIERTVRDQCDTLTLTPTHFVRSKGDQLVGRFRIDDFKPTMSFQEALGKILERDEILRKHLHLIVETPEEIICRIVLNAP